MRKDEILKLLRTLQRELKVEELACMGVRTIVGYGASGGLSSDLPKGSQIVIETALAVVLLSGAGLLAASWVNLQSGCHHRHRRLEGSHSPV